MVKNHKNYFICTFIIEYFVEINLFKYKDVIIESDLVPL